MADPFASSSRITIGSTMVMRRRSTRRKGMTVDRIHVLATPGMDAHSGYVALSRHRDGMELHYGRDDFAGQDRLVRTLSRDRAKDMAMDYERADQVRSYAERRGITFGERVAEIVRKVVP